MKYLFLLANLHICSCYVWNILLSNPDIGRTGEIGTEEDGSASVHRPRHLRQKFGNGTHGNRYLTRCQYQKDCNDKQYCDRHFGYCDNLKDEGELCRVDSQCASGLICIFGKCDIPVPDGLEGSRCKVSTDCNDDMCCARKHGEHVCKRRLSLGHNCYVPSGGVEYIINEQCSCQDHLICTNIKVVRQRPDTEMQSNSWMSRRRSNWRCVPRYADY